MLILGIDPGTKNLGAALIETDPPELIQSLQCDPKGALRIRIINSEIYPDKIVVEVPMAFSKAISAMLEIAFVAGWFSGLICSYYPDAEFIKIKAGKHGWRKFWGPDFDERWEFEKLFGDYPGISSHERDAALMAYAVGKDFKKQ